MKSSENNQTSECIDFIYSFLNEQMVDVYVSPLRKERRHVIRDVIGALKSDYQSAIAVRARIRVVD